MPNTKHKDIARIDQPSKRTFGWYVRVRFEDKQHTRFFSDRKCGGKNASLLSALAWKEEIHKKLGKPVTNRSIIYKARTNTGVVGVSLNEKMNRYGVSWTGPDGKYGKTTVSINKYGKEIAFQKACEIRRQKEAERLGIL